MTKLALLFPHGIPGLPQNFPGHVFPESCRPPNGRPFPRGYPVGKSSGGDMSPPPMWAYRVSTGPYGPPSPPTLGAKFCTYLRLYVPKFRTDPATVYLIFLLSLSGLTAEPLTKPFPPWRTFYRKIFYYSGQRFFCELFRQIFGLTGKFFCANRSSQLRQDSPVALRLAGRPRRKWGCVRKPNSGGNRGCRHLEGHLSSKGQGVAL